MYAFVFSSSFFTGIRIISLRSWEGGAEMTTNVKNIIYIESCMIWKKNQMNFHKIYKISIYNQLFNTHDTSIGLLIHLNRSNPITYTIPNSFNAIFDVEIKSCFCWYISLFSLSSWIHDFKLFFWFSDNAFVIRIVNLGINYFVL